MIKIILHILSALTLLFILAGCLSSADRAEELYEKGMSLLEKDPEKAEKFFKDALMMKKNMVKAMYGRALVSEYRDDFEGAHKFMNQALEQDPNFIEVLIKSCQLLLADGSLDLALERCNKALEVDRNNVIALNLRATLQLKLNDAKGAIDYANLALLRDPANQDAYLMLATERLLAKNEMKAIEYLDKALAKDGGNLSIQLIKAIVFENISKVQEAEQQYQKIIKLFPDSAFVRKCYIHFLLKHDRKDDAEEQLRAIAQSVSTKDIQAKLDVVKFVTATKGAEAGQAELESYVKKEPENYGLAFVLVNLYQAQKNTILEDNLLSQIVQKAGKTADGYRARGLMAYKLIGLGKKDEANKLLSTILEADKTNRLALTIRASMAMDAKNYSSAIADLRIVLSNAPKLSNAILMLASAYESSGSLKLAEEQYLRAFVTSKFSPTYGVPYSQFLLRLKQPRRADNVLKEMQDDPSNTIAVRSLAGGNDANTLSNLMYDAISSSKGNMDGSLSAYMRAHETDSDDTESILAIIRTYMRAGKSKEALDFIGSVLTTNPDNTEVVLLQGQVYASMGNTLKARQIVTDIIKTQPKNSLAYQQLALTQLSQNLMTDAESTVNQGLSFLPDDFELKLIKASVFETSGRYEQAIKIYENMLEIRPNSVMASNNLARLLLDYRSDSASINRAYALTKFFKDNRAPQFLDTFAWASYKVGNFDEAEKALKSAVEKQPGSEAIHYHLAKVYLAKNDRIRARQALQQAIKNTKNQQFEQREEVNQLLKTL